jgi:hypothetical protein
MPITNFQKTVLQLLKKHRNPNSYVAGGIAIHRGENSTRESRDIDVFHDTDQALAQSSSADISVLESEGFDVKVLIRQPGFVRVTATRSNNTLKLEWVRDTAFRFFPVLEDEQLGYRLHDVDLMINKCLALANRTEVRDIIDMLQLQETVFTVGQACFAACGKDPGFTPELVIDLMLRHSIVDPHQLSAESLTKEIDPKKLKLLWLEAIERAKELCTSLPSADLGCIYLDQAGGVEPSVDPANLDELLRHYGSVGGSWPTTEAAPDSK